MTQRIDAFEEAKKLDLVEFVKSTTDRKLTKSTQGYHSPVCPHANCGEGGPGSSKVSISTGRQVWKCFACAKGGSIVDYAAALWRMEPLDAAKALLGEDHPLVVVGRRSEDDDAERNARYAAVGEVCQKLLVAGLKYEKSCVSYLTGRGLSQSWVRAAVQRDLLRFLPNGPRAAAQFLRKEVGKDLLVQSGLLKPDKLTPGIAFRPIISFLPGAISAEFRLARDPKDDAEKKAMHYGPKSKPWFWQGRSGKARRVAVVEGWVDMGSLVCLGCESSIIGLPGVATWVNHYESWFRRLHVDYGASFILALDPDKAGQTQTGELAKRLTADGIPFKVKAPVGGDINDVLRAQIAKAKQAA